jgi:hypothetical protein
MQTTKEAAPTRAMPFPSGCPIEIGTGPPSGAPGDHNAGNVTGVGDSLDRRQYQVRRDPGETVHQCGRIAGKNIHSPKCLGGHGSILSILSIAQNRDSAKMSDAQEKLRKHRKRTRAACQRAARLILTD